MLAVTGVFIAGIVIYGIRYAIITKKDKTVAFDSNETSFRKTGEKYKIWSIVNTCIFSVFTLPILAIIETNKAQKAADREGV